MDFPRLSRLQRLMREIRVTLRSERPTLPHGAEVVQQNLPHGAEWAFGGDHALRVWYGDSTLHWIRFETFRADPARPVSAIVEFQPGRRAEVAIVEPDAMRAQLEGYRLLVDGRWAESAALFDRADSLQRDPDALVFRAYDASRRALALGRLGRGDAAVADARRAARMSPEDDDVRFILALTLAELSRDVEASAELDTLLRLSPGDPDGISLRARLAARAASER